MDVETSAETAAPSSKPVKELEKTELEYSTVKKVQSAKKGRQRFECLFRGGVDGSGTGGRKCGSFQGKPVKPKMKNRKDMTLDEVKAELIRRAKKEHDHERHVQNVEQQKAIAMEGQSTLDKYNTTPEMCDEVLAAASAGLPLNVTDNRHFRTCLAKVAACGTKFLRGYDDALRGRRTAAGGGRFGWRTGRRRAARRPIAGSVGTRRWLLATGLGRRWS